MSQGQGQSAQASLPSASSLSVSRQLSSTALMPSCRKDKTQLKQDTLQRLMSMVDLPKLSSAITARNIIAHGFGTDGSSVDTEASALHVHPMVGH